MRPFTYLRALRPTPCVRFLAAGLFVAIAGTSSLPATDYNVEGVLRSELPLEAQFRALVHRHEIDLEEGIPFDGLFTIVANGDPLDLTTTTALTFRLRWENVQALVASLPAVEPNQVHATGGGTTRVVFPGDQVSFRQPAVFPARFADPRSDGSSGFAFSRLEVDFTPAFLAFLASDGTTFSEPVGGALVVRRADGGAVGELPLELVFTRFDRRATPLSETDEWQSLLARKEGPFWDPDWDFLTDFELSDPDGPGDPGFPGDDLNPIPEPRHLPVILALFAAGWALIGRRRRSGR